jgi:hypothetical protein
LSRKRGIESIEVECWLNKSTFHCNNGVFYNGR